VIVHAKRAIFVHIQKTGGEAVCTALGQNPNCPEKHFFARDLRELYGDSWNSYFKFAFVRNPWDRLVSWWSMINAHRAAFANGAIKPHKFFRFVLEKATTFEEFLNDCDEEIVDTDGSKWIYRNQLDYLTDTSGQQIVDFVGRFETLQQDFDSIASKVFGGSIALPHVNKSQHRHYTDFFSPSLAERVGRRFERDINAFGYVFGH
jgi:sulfotransferase famil protein